MKTIIRILPALGMIALISAFTLLGDDNTGVTVGDGAPTFNLKNIDGKKVSLDDYKDRNGVVVIFTCNHCPYAKAYEDRIIALDQKYKGEGWPVIAINPNDPKSYPSDSYPNMKKRAKEKGFTFPYLFDETQDIARSYGATRTPHVFILKKDGEDFKVAYIGAIDDNYKDESAVEEKYVENAIEALRSGKEVNPSLTKAIGCGIKWKK